MIERGISQLWNDLLTFLCFAKEKLQKKRNQRRLTTLWNPGTGYRCSGRFNCGGLILCKQISVRPFNGLRQLNRCEKFALHRLVDGQT